MQQNISLSIDDKNILELLKQTKMELIKSEKLRKENPNHRIIYHENPGFYSPLLIYDKNNIN